MNGIMDDAIATSNNGSKLEHHAMTAKTARTCGPHRGGGRIIRRVVAGANPGARTYTRSSATTQRNEMENAHTARAPSPNAPPPPQTHT